MQQNHPALPQLKSEKTIKNDQKRELRKAVHEKCPGCSRNDGNHQSPSILEDRAKANNDTSEKGSGKPQSFKSCLPIELMIVGAVEKPGVMMDGIFPATKLQHGASRSLRILKTLGGCADAEWFQIAPQNQGLIHLFCYIVHWFDVWHSEVVLWQQRYSTGYVSCCSYTSRCHAVLFVYTHILYIWSLWLIESKSSMARYPLCANSFPHPTSLWSFPSTLQNTSEPHGFHLLESISKAYQVCLEWSIPLAGLTPSEMRGLLHKKSGFDIRPYVKSLFHYSWKLFVGRFSFWLAIEQTSLSNVHLKCRISQPGPREAFSLWRSGTNAGTDVDGDRGCGCYVLWRCFWRLGFMWCATNS